MVQILKTTVFAVALLAETVAFVPSAAKLSQRIDSSKWRLEQYDVPASYGGRIRSSNATDSTFVVDTYHSKAPAQPEEPIAVIDSVDMSHYQSSFRGLTAPSKAGLILSLLMTLAMVASSPGVDTSFLTSEMASFTQLIDESSFREFSAAWSPDMSQDLLPAAILNKIQFQASDLSPNMDNLVQQAREQAEVWRSNSALSYQQFQGFMNTVSEKSNVWQNAFSAESLKWQEQAVSTMNQWQAVVASKMMEAQQVAADVSAKGSMMMENGFSQATTFRDAVANSITTAQNSVGETVHELQTSIVAQFDERSLQWHDSMEEFRKEADEKMLREAPILKAEALRLISQYVDPIILAKNELWKSFNVELDRESTVANQAMLQSVSSLQTFWETKFAQLQDLPWGEASRDIETWTMEMKTALTEAAVKLQTDFATKVTDIRDVEIPGAQKAWQVSLEDFYRTADERIAELQTTVSAATVAAQEQAYSNLATWKEITAKEIAAERATFVQFYDDVILKYESAMAQGSDFRNHMASTLDQLKEDYESFKTNADTKMLAEGPVLKEKVMNVQAQTKSLFDNVLGKVDIPRFQDVVGTEFSKLYISFMSQAQPLQESLATNFDTAVNQVIPSAKDSIRESVDFARTETQSFASTAAATAKDITENAISTARSSGASVSDQVSGVVSTVTSKVDVKIDVLPDTNSVVNTVKLADKALPTYSQNDVSSESLSSLYDRLQDQLLKST